MDSEIKLNFWIHVAFFGFILAACGIYGVGFAPAEMVKGNAEHFLALFLIGTWTLIGGCVAILRICKNY